MGYTTKDFIDSNKFPEMKLISDNSGINREIRGVQIIVAPNMENFLGGGELLLTSLSAYEKLDDHMMVSHLNELNKKQISGFIVKRKQNTAHLNKLFETLLCFCEEHNIPVLELPQDISYWLVIKYVLSQMCSNIVNAKFIYSKMTRDEISRYFVEGGIREKIIENLMCALETMIGNPIALYDEQFHNICSSTSEPTELEILKDNQIYVPNIITQFEYIRQKRKNVEYIKEIDILDQSKYYLLISEINEPLMELDFITLEGAVTTLLYILTQNEMIKNIKKKYHRDLEYRMLNGSLSESEEEDVANLLDLNTTDEYRVITFYLKSVNSRGNFSAEQRKETKIVEKAVFKFVPKEYIFCNTNRIIYIHKENEKERKREFRRKLEKFQKETQDQLTDRKEQFEFLIGIGKSVKGYHELKDSFEDSKTAIEYIDVIRKITGDIQKSVVDCSKLGFFHIFANIKDEKQLRTYIPDTVHEIHQYDVQKNGELIDTLECYLNHKQSIRKTSELMGVHARTVSYRLQKIAELTGMDLDNVAEMLAVRNGIIILKILELL